MVTPNEIKSIYQDKIKEIKSTNGHQAPVITAEQIALFATIAEIVNQNKVASTSMLEGMDAH